MNAQAPRPQDETERRRRRAERMIRALVARLEGATAHPPDPLAEHPHACGPGAPPGQRSGEGASSVLPYLRQSRRARARPSDEQP